MRGVALVLSLSLIPALAVCADSAKGAGKWSARARAGKDLYATFHTTLGDVVIKLFPKDAPKTVENFVALAAGEKEWTDPRTNERTKRPLYDGTVFHRVIEGFMIQGGDPLGTGTGTPGFQFGDEFQSGRRFDKPGILAMANAGPGTNGSQFFITVAPTPHLTNHHTIFGDVVSGYDVVEAISHVPKAPGDKPLEPVVIKKIELSDKGPKTEASK
jgi:peptidyl-prolyl cis-trans isomerase A (cyclophilin A)